MRVWMISSLKGGTGKSALTRLLAVHMAEKKTRVAVVDGDPQDSLGGWAARRTAEPAVKVYPAAELADALKSGADLVIIDCPPSFLPIVRKALAAASMVIVQIRTSFDDIDSAQHMVAEAAAAGKKYGFVLTAFDPATKYATETRGGLDDALFGTISASPSFNSAGEVGLTGAEAARNPVSAKLRKEVGAIVKAIEAKEAARG